MALWSLWEERHIEQRAPLIQSKQNILHSLLWALGWFLHWPKNLVSRSGFSHGGHLLSPSFTPYTQTIQQKKPIKFKKNTATNKAHQEQAHYQEKGTKTYIFIAKHHFWEYGYWSTEKRVVDYVKKVDEKSLKLYFLMERKRERREMERN